MLPPSLSSRLCLSALRVSAVGLVRMLVVLCSAALHAFPLQQCLGDACLRSSVVPSILRTLQGRAQLRRHFQDRFRHQPVRAPPASASLALLRPSPSPAASPLRTSLPRRCLLGLLPRSPALSSGRDGTVEGWPDAAREINSLRRRAFLGHLKLDLADAV